MLIWQALCARIARILFLSGDGKPFHSAQRSLQSEAPTAKIVASLNSMRKRRLSCRHLTGAGKVAAASAARLARHDGQPETVTFVMRRSGSCTRPQWSLATSTLYNRTGTYRERRPRKLLRENRGAHMARDDFVRLRVEQSHHDVRGLASSAPPT